MCNILCVTNRNLSKEDFFVRLEKIADTHPAGIILREKDLSECEYTKLAEQALKICDKCNTQLIIHNFIHTAEILNISKIHLPMNKLSELSAGQKKFFLVLGASCHSIEDAKKAENLGCTYITAGHIYNTDCKKDLPGRGLDFLKAVCKNVSVPVYAIGGINYSNFSDVMKAGAKGACIMKSIMQAENVNKFITEFRER